jgi:hypothetical protein
VSFIRRQKIDELLRLFPLVNHPPGHSAAVPMARNKLVYETLKAADDVFSKMVFRVSMNVGWHGDAGTDWDSGSVGGAGGASGGGGGGDGGGGIAMSSAWVSHGSIVDPVIPSLDLKTMKEYFRQQLWPMYHRDFDTLAVDAIAEVRRTSVAILSLVFGYHDCDRRTSAAPFFRSQLPCLLMIMLSFMAAVVVSSAVVVVVGYQSLVPAFTAAAAKVRDVSSKYYSDLALHLHKHRLAVTDASLGLRLKASTVDGCDIVEIKFVDPLDGVTGRTVELLRGHYDRLRAAYLSADNVEALLLAALFAMVMRYESLSMYKVWLLLRSPANAFWPPHRGRHLHAAALVPSIRWGISARCPLE